MTVTVAAKMTNCGISGSAGRTNCGRKVAKKINALGFEAETTYPVAKTRQLGGPDLFILVPPQLNFVPPDWTRCETKGQRAAQ
jgi:hypothetical protein